VNRDVWHRFNVNAGWGLLGDTVILLIFAKTEQVASSWSTVLVIVAGMLASHADAFAVFVQEDGNGYKYTRQEGRKACLSSRRRGCDNMTPVKRGNTAPNIARIKPFPARTLAGRRLGYASAR
jgi:hypothetical protein